MISSLISSLWTQLRYFNLNGPNQKAEVILIKSIYYTSRQSCQFQIMPRKSQQAPVTHGEHQLDYTSAIINRDIFSFKEKFAM